MNRKIILAVAIQVSILVLVIMPPLLVSMTGTVVYLETQKMDPRSLMRGDYVILGYKAAQNILTKEMAVESKETGKAVYVTFTTDRPAKFVAADLERPELKADQVCITGRVRSTRTRSVDFPQIAQIFVPEGKGKEIESKRGENLLARAAVSGRCNAVLLGLEDR